MLRAGALTLLVMFLACARVDTLTVQVTAPTGDRERDRASVRAAFDSVRPGGTV
jgi:hypothetical protein